jgi:hypothetical protein
LSLILTYHCINLLIINYIKYHCTKIFDTIICSPRENKKWQKNYRNCDYFFVGLNSPLKQLFWSLNFKLIFMDLKRLSSSPYLRDNSVFTDKCSIVVTIILVYVDDLVLEGFILASWTKIRNSKVFPTI